MDLSSLSTLIRQQIGQAETAAALKTLLAFLQGNPKHKAFYNIALNIQSLYSRTLQKELKGAVTQEQASVNYTLVNDSIIQLLDQIESGASIPKGFDPKVRAQRMQLWQLILTGIIALVAVGALFFFLRKDQVQTACPDFPEPSQLDVLLIPFVNLSEGELKPEYGIKERLEKYCADYKLNTHVRVYDSYFQRAEAQLPDFNLAGSIASECQAGLIIWGTAERLANGRIDCTSKFKFLGKGEKFELQKIQFDLKNIRFEGETQVDTILSISTISREGNITKDVEQLVAILFGLLAHDQGNHEAAIASLKPADTSNVDTANIILTQMVLADSYLSLGQPEKAQKCYNRVLKVHPEYKLALNNQAFIQLENKNPKEAEKLFTKIIQLDSTNTQALAGRAAARIEMKQEIKAEEDVKRIREIDPKARFPVLEKVKVLRDER